jgi:hypothetical protein
MVARELIMSIWHQRDLRRLNLQNKVDKSRFWVSLDIELGSNQRLERVDIRTTYMPFVRTWVDRNSLCAKAFAITRKQLYIWHITTTRITQSSDLIYIYT